MLYGDAAFAAIDDVDPNRRRRSNAPPRPRPPPRDQTAQRALLAEVWAALRPPDELPPRVRLIPPRPPADDEDDQPLQDDGIPGVADAPPAAPAPHRVDLLTEVLSIPDIQFVVAHFLLSRAELVRLRCASRTLRRLVDGSAALGYLGLFRTPFGAEHGCRLQPHQLRSLRHMAAAENPTGWRFGELRGGVLADDPGLGKTVTVLALVVRAPPRARAIPGAQFGAQFSDALPLLDTGALGRRLSVDARRVLEHRGRLDPAADQPRRPPLLLRVLNPISRELHAPTDSDRAEGRNFAPYLNPAGLRDFEERLRPLLAFANSGGDPQLRIFPTLDSFSRALDGVIRAAVAARGATADGAAAAHERTRAPRAQRGPRAAGQVEPGLLCDGDRQACDV